MSAFKNWRLRCGVLLLVVLAGCNAGSGLDGDTTDSTPPPETENGVATRTIDATRTDEWVYFDLASNAVVYPADANNSSDWDIAFQRFKIKVNGGVSGKGGARVAVLKNTAFASATAVPAGIPYYVDRALGELGDAELISLDAGQFFAVCAVGFTCIDTQRNAVDRAHLNPDIAAYAMLTIGSGVLYEGGTQKPILGWYNYYFDENHVLRPTNDTWLIKTVGGLDIKLQMLGYYGQANNSEAGNMAFSYQSLTPGFTVPPPGSDQLKAAIRASTLHGSAPLGVDFTAAVSGGTGTSWSWDFGDGSSSTAMAPTHIYRQPGTFVAKVTVADQRGARASHSVTIVVDAVGNQPPIANAGPDQFVNLGAGIAQAQVTLDASASSDADGTIVSYAWAGSPKPNDEISPLLTLGIGRYTFALTVTDDHGVTATDTVEVTISSSSNAPPTAAISATPTRGAAPLAVQFDGGGSVDSDGTLVSYVWDFDDGTSASGAIVQHTYTQPGQYTATLTVTDDGGAIATATRAIDATIVAAPSADTYVYEFLGNQTPSESLLAWNHESNHGARILMDFDALDAKLPTLAAGHFTATLNLYVICDLNAGIGLVGACPGYPDADGPGGIATVTTDIRSQGLAWTENGIVPWSGVQEGTLYKSFTVDNTGYWLGVDVTMLVEAWRSAGSTGNGIVLTQEAYPVVRADNGNIAVLGFYSKESVETDKRPYLEIHIDR